MHGLTVRWSLADAPEGVEEALAAYVEATSHARFTGICVSCHRPPMGSH